MGMFGHAVWNTLAAPPKFKRKEACPRNLGASPGRIASVPWWYRLYKKQCSIPANLFSMSSGPHVRPQKDFLSCLEPLSTADPTD